MHIHIGCDLPLRYHPLPHQHVARPSGMTCPLHIPLQMTDKKLQGKLRYTERWVGPAQQGSNSCKWVGVGRRLPGPEHRSPTCWRAAGELLTALAGVVQAGE